MQAGELGARRALFSDASASATEANEDIVLREVLVRTPGKPELRTGDGQGRARPYRSQSTHFRETHLKATQAHEADPGAGSRARRRDQLQRELSQKYIVGMDYIARRHELEDQRHFIQMHDGMGTPAKILSGGQVVPRTEKELDEMIGVLDRKILQINAEHSAAAAEVRRIKDDRLEALVTLSPATRVKLGNYQTANSRNKSGEPLSYRQYGWNALAGLVGYLPFAFGPLVSPLTNPYVGAAGASVLWFINERLGPPLLRSVSQPNRAADRIVALYKLGADALEERIVGIFGVRVQADRVVLVDDEVTPVTAAQLRERAQQRANGSYGTLYRLKVIPDDVTSGFYGINYAVRNLVCGHFFAHLSRPPVGQQPTLANWGFEAGTSIAAGMLAGMFYSLSMQAARRHYATLIDSTLGGGPGSSMPNITRPFAIWRLRALYLQHYLTDLRKTAGREDLADADRLYINAVADIVATKLARARSKSSFLGNVALEARNIVKSGERRNNAANLISKFASLCLYATVSHLYAGWQPGGNLSTDAMHYLVKGAAIVFPLAYPNRTEIFGVTVYALATLNGLRRGMQHQVALKAAQVGDGIYSMMGSWAPDFTFWRTQGANTVATSVLPLQDILVSNAPQPTEQNDPREPRSTLRRHSVERGARAITPGGRSARTLAYAPAQAQAVIESDESPRRQVDTREADPDTQAFALRQRKISASGYQAEKLVQRAGTGRRTPGESPTKAVLGRGVMQPEAAAAVVRQSGEKAMEGSHS